MRRVLDWYLLIILLAIATFLFIWLVRMIVGAL